MGLCVSKSSKELVAGVAQTQPLDLSRSAPSAPNLERLEMDVARAQKHNDRLVRHAKRLAEHQQEQAPDHPAQLLMPPSP